MNFNIWDIGMKNKSIFKILIALLCLITVVVIGLYATDTIGIPESKIELDIRKNSHIDASWEITGEASNTIAAYISYPENQSHHSFSIYVNRPGFSFGYFFRGGGSIYTIDTKIAKFVVEDYTECAYLSMNRMGAVLLEIDDGNTIQEIKLDPQKPFAVVLPINVGTITFSDEKGNVIEYLDEKL